LPKADYDAGIVDVATSALMLPANDLFKLNDSHLFKKNWKVAKSKTWVLQPGKSFTFSHSVKDIQYEPSSTGTETYQKKLKSHVFHIRVSGCVQGIAHNAAGTLLVSCLLESTAYSINDW